MLTKVSHLFTVLVIKVCLLLLLVVWLNYMVDPSCWLEASTLLFSSDLLHYPIGAFSYVVFFSDCFGSSFELEVLEPCLFTSYVAKVSKSMFISYPFRTTVFFISLFTMLLILIWSLTGLYPKPSVCCFSYNLILFYSSISVHFSLFINGLHLSLFFLLLSWWLALIESGYIELIEYRIDSLELNWFKIAIYALLPFI